MSKCSKCLKDGHNARSCRTKARQDIKKAKEEPERIEIDGVTPKRGLWIVHEKKQILVGKIRKVTPTGEIHYTSILGAQVETAQKNFIKGGYTYTEVEPYHLKWKLGLT